MVLKKAADKAKRKIEKAELVERKDTLLDLDKKKVSEKIDEFFLSEKAIPKDYDYPDFKADKDQYYDQVKLLIHGMIEDKSVSRNEMRETIGKLKIETRRFRGEVLKSQYDFEKEKFDKWNSEELPVLVGNAKFEEVFKHIKDKTQRLKKLGFKDNFYIFNDLKNAEIETKTQKGLYDLLKPGVKIEGMKGANIIVGKNNNKVTLRPGDLQAGTQSKTYRWIELWGIIQKENLKLTHVDESGKKQTLGLKDAIEEKEWNEMQTEKERILVDKMERQINNMIKMLPKQRVTAVFNKHPLNSYIRLSNAKEPVISFTRNFTKLPILHKANILEGVIVGVEIQQQKEKIDKLAKNNEAVALYTKAEKYMENGLPYLAYKYFLQCDTKLAKAEQRGVKLSELQEGAEGFMFTRKTIGDQLKIAGLMLCSQARDILRQSGVPGVNQPPLRRRDPAYDFIDYAEKKIKEGVPITRIASSTRFKTSRNILKDIAMGLNPHGVIRREAVKKSGTWAAKTVMEEKHYKNYDWMLTRANKLRRRRGQVLPMRSDLKKTDIELAKHLYKFVATNSMAENGMTDSDEYQKSLVRARNQTESSILAKSAFKGRPDKDTFAQHALNKLKKDDPNFENMPKEEQELLASQMRESMVNNIAQERARANYLSKNMNKAAKYFAEGSGHGKKDYIKAAKEYVDMTNHFNSINPAKWADTTWDSVVENTVVTSAGMIMAGGLSNMVGGGVKLGLIKLLGKHAAGKIAQSGVWVAKVGAESVVFDLAQESFQGLKTGEFSWKSFKGRMGYSLALSTALNLGGLGKIFPKLGGAQARAMQAVTPWAKKGAIKGFKGIVQKSTQLGASMAARAGVMTGMAYALDPYHANKSALRAYSENLRTMATVAFGQRLFNAATGNAIPRAMQAMDHKAQMAALKARSTPETMGSIKTLQDMVKKGEMPSELALRIANKGAKINDLMALRNLATEARFKLIQGENPKSVLKSAEYKEYQRLSSKLGLSPKVTQSLIQSNLDPAVILAAKVRSEAMDSLIKKAGEIKTKVKNLTGKSREAWHTFMTKCEGNYQKFLNRYPKLANAMPSTLKDAAMKIGVVGVAALSGTHAFMGLLERGIVHQKSNDLTRQAENINTKHKLEVLNEMTKGVDAQTKELIKKTFFDNATGMLNRNGLKFLDNMIEKKLDFSIASYDADHFKAYNDIIGEAYGDRTIKVIAKNINKVVGELKKAGYESHSIRMGGEEIVLFTTAPNTLLKTKMESMKENLKKEILSTISKKAKMEMAETIYQNKYAGQPDGRDRAIREIGGSTAGISKFDGDTLKRLGLLQSSY